MIAHAAASKTHGDGIKGEMALLVQTEGKCQLCGSATLQRPEWIWPHSFVVTLSFLASLVSGMIAHAVASKTNGDCIKGEMALLVQTEG